MGSSQSSLVTDTFTSINQNVSNIMLKMKSDNSSLCSASQNKTVNIGNIIGCNTNINQTLNVNCNALISTKFSSNTEIIKVMTQAIDRSVTSGQKSVQDFLATSFSSQKGSTNVATYLKQLVQTNFTQDMASSCMSTALLNQGSAFNLGTIDCTKGGSLNVSQDAQLIQLVNCVTDFLSSIATNDAVIQQASSSSSTTQSSEQQGLGSIMKYAMIATAIVVVIGLIAFVYIAMSPAGQDAIKNASKK
jgi:hypothetical protein